MYKRKTLTQKYTWDLESYFWITYTSNHSILRPIKFKKYFFSTLNIGPRNRPIGWFTKSLWHITKSLLAKNVRIFSIKFNIEKPLPGPYRYYSHLFSFHCPHRTGSVVNIWNKKLWQKEVKGYIYIFLPFFI